jgi:pyrroline-5-carboxylate reductase
MAAFSYLPPKLIEMKKIAIIGGGNLGTAIAEGLLESQFVLAQNIMVTKRNLSTIAHLQAKGIQISSDNAKAIREADVIILAVKPYNYQSVIAAVKKYIQPKKHLLISVITGVFINDLEKAIGKSMPIVRAMPNTATAIRQSMTCLSFANCTTAQQNFTHQLFEKLGGTVTIDESLMDAATVLGACATAFAMRYIRANIQGGIEIGFDAKTASLIAAQTIYGAAELLLKKQTHPEAEIDKVTTPKGCTIAGLNEMEHQGFSSSIIKGIATSYHKIVKG